MPFCLFIWTQFFSFAAKKKPISNRKKVATFYMRIFFSFSLQANFSVRCIFRSHKFFFNYTIETHFFITRFQTVNNFKCKCIHFTWFCLQTLVHSTHKQRKKKFNSLFLLFLSFQWIYLFRLCMRIPLKLFAISSHTRHDIRTIKKKQIQNALTHSHILFCQE